jgi:hypothetical protein
LIKQTIATAIIGKAVIRSQDSVFLRPRSISHAN